MHPVVNAAIRYICDRIATSGNNASRSSDSSQKCNVIQ
jgi:hypothetical protein